MAPEQPVVFREERAQRASPRSVARRVELARPVKRPFDPQSSDIRILATPRR
jgi:hypothetical protein